MSDPDPPLDYRNPGDDRRPISWWAVVGGAVCGVGLVGVGGVFCFGVALGAATVPYAPYHLTGQAGPEAVGFAALGGFAALTLAPLIWRTRLRRPFLLGFLLAVGVTSLVEGDCFHRL